MTLKTKKQSGFTVVELLVIIILFGALAVSSITMSRSMLPKSYLSTAINSFSADFSYARQLASKQNRYIAFVFNSAGTSYTIMSQKKIGEFGSGTNYWTPVKKKINVEPMKGNKFIQSPTSFAVNSLGVVKDYPSCSGVTSVDLDFFISKGDINYECEIKIYQNGGIRVGQIKQK